MFRQKKKFFIAMHPCNRDLTVVAFQWTKSGDALPGAFLRVASNGFKNGVIINMKDAVGAVSKALEGIREKIGVNISDVYCTVSSSDIKISSSEGIVLLSRYGREIRENDIKKCVEIAKTVKVPLDKEVLHSVIKSFTVDNQENIIDPIKLEAVKLKANINNITVDSNVLKNLSKCISQAGFLPAGFVFSPLASSFRALEEKDKKAGVVLMNITPGLTECVLFSEGILYDFKIFAFGSDQLIDEDGSEINKQLMTDIKTALQQMSGWLSVKKIILTGDVVLNDNFIELMEPFFSCQIKAGKCIAKPFEHLPPDKAGYISSLGVVDYLQYRRNKQAEASGWRFVSGHISSFIDKYF